MPTSENSIEMIIEPKVSDLGDGFQVRRLLPSMKRRNVGPFVFWDHMGPVEIEGDKELKVLNEVFEGSRAARLITDSTGKTVFINYK